MRTALQDSTRRRRWHALLMVSLLLAAAPTAAVLAEEEPAAQEQPQVAPTPAPATGARSLAEAAGAIKLNRQAVGEDGRIVISNRNLDQLAGEGKISVAGTTGTPDATSAPDAAQAADAPTAQQEWQQRYDEQFAKVHDLEYNLQDFERRVDEAKDAYYPHGPHDRAPGTQSPNAIVDEQVKAELEAEKKKLDQLKRDAGRQGVEIKEPEYRRPEEEKKD